MPSPKVFVSHSHLDYDKAILIKEDLERYGLEVFVAHKDITPSLEWRNEIVGQIYVKLQGFPLVRPRVRNSRC